MYWVFVTLFHGCPPTWPHQPHGKIQARACQALRSCWMAAGLRQKIGWDHPPQKQHEDSLERTQNRSPETRL